MNGQSGNHMRRFDFSHFLLEPLCTPSFPGYSTAMALKVSMDLACELSLTVLCRRKIERAIEILVFVYYITLSSSKSHCPVFYLRMVTSVLRIIWYGVVAM